MRYKLNLLALISIFIVISFISEVSAQPPFVGVSTSSGLTIDVLIFGSLKQNSDFTLHIHVYNTSSGLNLSNATTKCNVHLYNSTGNHILRKDNMSYDGKGDWELIINKGNFTQAGSYALEAWCTTGALGGSERLYFEVTPSGDTLDVGESPILYIIIGIEILFALFFFGLGYKSNGLIGQIIFFGLSGIMLVVGLLYSLVLAEQITPTQLILIDGLTTLWSVIKILIGIALILLILFTLLNVYWSWNKKRGFTD